MRIDSSRFRGSLVGLAVGDALGAPVEFGLPGHFIPVTDFRGGGTWNLKPGQWTDDTSMALCLAESLVESLGFDARDQMQRYVRWYKDGYLSSTGRCFDIGPTTRLALDKFLRTGDPFAGSSAPTTAGNGSLMRLAPVPLFFADQPEIALARAADSSRTTHAAAEAVDACRFMAALIVMAVNGTPKNELLSDTSLEKAARSCGNLSPAVHRIASGQFKQDDRPVLKTNGYVIESLQAALWALHVTNDFKSGCLAVVNLGLDSDTNGAIYGQLAGAIYGIEAIPVEWRAQLFMRERIEELALRLFEAGRERV